MVAHNFYREYLEEMFNIYIDPHSHYKSIYGYKQVKYLKELEKNNTSKLYLTGICISLTNLRPEICTLYLIRTPEWFEKYASSLKFNDEYVILDSSFSPVGKGYTEIPFNENDNELIDRHKILQPSLMTPSAAAACAPGVGTRADPGRCLGLRLWGQ